MPTAIQIEVLLDDHGVVRGVQNVNKEFDKLGASAASGTSRAGEGFQKMESAQRKAHESIQLLSGTIGLQIPRDVEKVIAKMPGLSTALSLGFNAAAIIGVTAAVGDAITHIDELKGKYQELHLRANAILYSDIRGALTERDNRELFRPIQDQVEALHRSAEVTGKQGFGQITAQLKASNEQLDSMADKFKEGIEKQFGYDTTRTTSLNTRLSRKVQEMKAFNGQVADEQAGALRRQNILEDQHIEQAGTLSRLQGLDAINEKERQSYKDIDNLRKQGLIQTVDVERRKTEATRQAIYDRRELLHKNAEDTLKIEENTAVAALPEYARGTAKIEAEYRQRSRELEDLYGRSLISQDDYNRRSVALEKERTAQIRDENQRLGRDIGQQLSSIYDDITNGSIGNRIKKEFQDLFFHILGDWLSTMNGMRKASAGYNGQGGLFGALLASVLGVGRAPGTGSGPYGLPPGVASQFDDSGPFGLGGGIGSLPSGYGGITGLGRVLTGGSGGSDIGIPGSTPVGGASGGVSQRVPGILGGLLSAGSLSKLAPIALLGALSLGSKGGNSAIAAGGLIGALGIAALHSSNPAVFGAALPFTSLLGPLAGGLVGLGVGMNHGPLAGTLSGAGTGAMVGLYAGGPIGAAIGAIVGGLAGLFSGLFGGKPSKHSQADKYLQANVLPLIRQELTSYEGFSTDYTTAFNDLERLKSQSYDQMRSQFGKDATNDEWGRYIVPAIKQAEDQINTDQAERNRRAGLVFGAPQFAGGGQFQIGSGGRGVAILDHGEVVMSQPAVRMFGASTLLAMNQAAKSGTGVGGETHIYNINAIDTQSFVKFLDRGGSAAIANGIRRRQMEGRQF